MAIKPDNEAYRRYRQARRRHRAQVAAAQVLLLGIGLFLWEVAAARHWVDPMLTSKPSAVWHTFWKLTADGTLLLHTGVSLAEALAGLAIGMGIGILTAVALWWWPILAQVLDPYLVVLNAIPKVALGPVLYIWLGEVHSVYGMAVAISVVVTILMVYVGFREAEGPTRILMRTLGATRYQVLQKVVMPASLPTMMAALRISIGLTMVGVIMGEFIASRAGLGYLIIYGGQVFQMDLVMTSIAVLAVISALMYLGVSWLERAVVHLFHLRPRD